MSEDVRKKLEDFRAWAHATLALDVLLTLVFLAARLAAPPAWPQMLFLDVFRLEGMGFLAALLTPQPLFSPLGVAAASLAAPLVLQAGALALLWRVVRNLRLRARVLYPLIGLLPMFGPAAAGALLESLEDLSAGHASR